MEYYSIPNEGIQFVKTLYKQQGYSYLKELCAGKRDGKHYEPHHLADIGVVSHDEVDKYIIEIGEHLDNISNYKYKKDKINKLIELEIIIRDLIFYSALRKGIENNKYTKDDLVFDGIIKKDEVNLLYTKEEHLTNIKNSVYKSNIKMIIEICNIIYKDINNFDEALAILGKETKYFKDSNDLHKAIYGCPEKQELPKEYSIKIDTLGAPTPKRTDVFIFGNKRAGKSCLMSGLVYYMMKGKFATQPDGNVNKNGNEYCKKLRQAIEQKRLIRFTAEDEFHYFQLDVKDDKNDIHHLTFYEMAGEMFEKTKDEDFKKVNIKLYEHIVANPNDKILFFIIDYKSEIETRQDQTTLTEDRFDRLLDYFSGDALDRINAIATIVTKWDIAELKNQKTIDEFKSKGKILEPDDLVTPYNFLKTYSTIDGKITALQDKRRIPKNSSFFSIKKDKIEELQYHRLRFSLGQFCNENCYEYDNSYSENLYKWLMLYTKIINRK